MRHRRHWLLTLIAGLVALSVVVGSALADELIGMITKVDPEAKKLTVVEKETGKETAITTTADTEFFTTKGSYPIDLEKIARSVKKAQDNGKKGYSVVITHEKGVASKITTAKKASK